MVYFTYPYFLNLAPTKCSEQKLTWQDRVHVHIAHSINRSKNQVALTLRWLSVHHGVFVDITCLWTPAEVGVGAEFQLGT